MKLLRDHAVFRVYRRDNGGQEEGQALDCDVVEQEDEGCRKSYGAKDASHELGGIQFI